jgi:transcription elongation factor Elf1
MMRVRRGNMGEWTDPAVETMKQLLELARENLRRKVKCPICGRKTVFKETRETSSIGLDVFECEKCGLIFYIP